MKIIFICTKSITFNTFLKSQADYFIKRGHEVAVACSDSNKLNFKRDLTYNIDFPNRIVELLNPFSYLKIFIQIRRLINKNSSGIFYLHTPLASHLFRLFSFFNKIKIIYFVHGFRFTINSNKLKGIFFKIIEKILSYKTNIFITINKHDFNYIRSNYNKKASCHKINGVGLDLLPKHFKNKIKNKKEIKKILVIAAYKKDKGYLEILKVAELLKNRDINIVCYGYGNPSKYNYIKTKKKLNNIFFNNFDKKLKNKIKKFDILLHLSKREGLPVSVIQSLAEGLPVICYNIRGNNDLIKDRINGYFVNSYKEVPNKIHYLNLEVSLYNKMRFDAFQSIDKNFEKKKINLNLINILKKLSKH